MTGVQTCALPICIAEPVRQRLAPRLVANVRLPIGGVGGRARHHDLDRALGVVIARPDWARDDDAEGAIKVVMTGSASDPADWQPHIRNKPRREALANRFRDAGDPLRIVLVRDMWLTGFDAPSLSTMYIDKPMRGHGLMQAIARVDRKSTRLNSSHLRLSRMPSSA